jgi:RNA polymerase sigma factor (sigma-70 family)
MVSTNNSRGNEVTKNLSEKAKHDYDLVLKAIEGDQRSYAELLERYRDAIYYMLLKMVNNQSDAEDLTIEAFGKAFKNIEQYAPNYAFSTWLFKIATNNCIDFIRKKKANLISLDQEDNDFDAPSHNIKANMPDPEETLINEQKVKMMHTVVNKLKPRYRKLIELRYFKEYSYEEISEELELPIGTVKAQLFRARELLFNILKHAQHKM